MTSIASHTINYKHSLIATALQEETDPIFAQWLAENPGITEGIPVKATFTEVNAGVDDSKFITPKALYDSNYNNNNNSISTLLALSISL